MTRRTRVYLIIMVASFILPGASPAQPSPDPAGSDSLAGSTAGGLTSSGLEDLTRQQRLTLEKAQKIALDNNLDLVNARRDVRLAELDIIRAKAGYDPYFKADANYSSSTKPSSQAIFGQTSETGSINLSSGMSTITGGNVSLSFNNSRQESDSFFSTLNPSYNTDLSLNVSQPLLKNRFNDTRAMELTQKENDYERTRLALESKVLEIESQVEENYWSLVRARLDLDLRRQGLELSERMHRITLTQVRAGTAARVSTLQTEANLASSKATLVRSENDYRKAQFTLKVVLNLEADDLWNLEIIPMDMPRYDPPEVTREEIMDEAMKNNFTLRQARLSLTNAEISNDQAKNRTLPQLDFRASVGVSGLAGTDNPQDQIVETGFVIPNPLPPALFPQPYILERTTMAGQPSDYEGDYFDAVENMFDNENLSWSAGLTFQVPIGNRAAKSDLKQTLLSFEKQLSDLHNQERQVFMNLINLIYDLEASHRNFLAAREANRLQEQNREMEEKKFSLGLNTSYEVLQAEESWGEARSSEIGALIDYTRTVGRVERARKGYLSGGVSSTVPITIPSGLSAGGGLPSGVDTSSLDSLAGQLPAGMDINMLKSFIP